MEKSKGHLTHEDRQIIYVMHDDGVSDSRIAKVLGRDRSVVWKERRRNRPPVYLGARLSPLEKAKVAQDKAQRRRSDCKRGTRGPLKLEAVRSTIITHLELDHYSPENISILLKQSDLGVTVSGKTIRRWMLKQAPELRQHLPQRGKPRRNRLTKRRSKRPTAAPHKRNISERSPEINDRIEAGHFESDALVCKQSKAAIISVRERKTRHRWFKKVDNLQADTVRAALIQIFAQIPTPLRLSNTYDNGGEFAHFDRLEHFLNLTAYFCDPYCAWQKGAVENQNKEFRRFFPKGTDLALVADHQIAAVARSLNAKPMLCLGKMSAAQVWTIELNKARHLLH